MGVDGALCGREGSHGSMGPGSKEGRKTGGRKGGGIHCNNVDEKSLLLMPLRVEETSSFGVFDGFANVGAGRHWQS